MVTIKTQQNLEVNKQRKQKEQENEKKGIKDEVVEEDCFKDEEIISNAQLLLTPKLKSSCNLL